MCSSDLLVALPLCLGIALASGATLFAGIIAVIVGGLVVSLASGSSVSVSVPTAVLAVMVGAGGVILIVFSIIGKTGEHMTRWSWRGMFFIVLSVAVFSFTVQRFGLIVAGPGSMMVAMLASPDIKWGEGIIFSVIMTAFCALLFKTALGLPIPVNNLW